MKVSIVILHFGDVSVTKACIASLGRFETYPYSLIVVNNMPYDLEPKDLSSKHAHIINNRENLGFAKGVNIGIKQAIRNGSDAVSLLNNDTTIKKPFLKNLVTTMESDTRIGIVAPAIKFVKKGEILFDLGGKLNHVIGRTSHTEVGKIDSKEIRFVEYVSGCCCLIRKEVFQKVGYFDTQFFLYYEDVDFCIRASQAGFGIAVIPTVFIDHALSKSAGKVSEVATFHQIRSAILFGRKHLHNPISQMSNILFIFMQVILFIKANPTGAIGGVKALATFVKEKV